MLSIILVLFFMPKYIRFLQRLDATSDFDKDGKTKSPPIMGGLLLVIVVEVVSLLVCQMNGYTISTLVILTLFSAVGATDDMAKVRAKRLVNQGKLKAAEYMDKADGISSSLRLFLYFLFSFVVAVFCYKFIPELKGDLTIPFCPIDVFQIHLPNWIFVAFMTFVIAASANGTNFTDGLDSLVSVPILTSMVFVGLVAYVSGNFIFSQYLSVPYLPGCDELFPLATAIAGALLAYLWFNSPPAEIYMGDAGSVGFGAAIGIMFILVQAGLFLPIVCIIIIAEACSVLMQITWFKITKKTTGTGKRIFRYIHGKHRGTDTGTLKFFVKIGSVVTFTASGIKYNGTVMRKLYNCLAYLVAESAVIAFIKKIAAGMDHNFVITVKNKKVSIV